jgi:ParB/RepB/Spo0J family partition protein
MPATDPNHPSGGFRRPQPVPIARLEVNPFQPRQGIDPKALEPLVGSIRGFGFMGHVETRPRPEDPGRLQIVFGHRRVRAAELAGLASVPVAVVPRSDDEMRRASYVENATQEALTYWEDGQYFKRMQEELFLTIDEVAALCGKKKGYVQNRLDVLRLPEGSALREAAPEVAVTVTAAVALVTMDRAEQEALFARLRAGEINTTDIKAIRTATNRPLPDPVVRGRRWRGRGRGRTTRGGCCGCWRRCCRRSTTTPGRPTSGGSRPTNCGGCGRRGSGSGGCCRSRSASGDGKRGTGGGGRRRRREVGGSGCGKIVEPIHLSGRRPSRRGSRCWCLAAPSRDAIAPPATPTVTRPASGPLAPLPSEPGFR